MGVTGLSCCAEPPGHGASRRRLVWCGVVRSGVAAMVLPFVMVHRCHRIASAGVVQPTGAGGRGNIVISHTRWRHGVVVGVGNISKHPLTVSSGPGTGSRSGGQLSRLSIGRIGLQLPGGVDAGWTANGSVLPANGALWCHRVSCRTRHGLASQHTRSSPLPSSSLAASARHPHCPRFAAALPRLRSTVSRGLGEGGWATIDRTGPPPAGQPQRRRSSSRLCRPCSHGQALLLANKFSALIYAKPPLYH
jgi:hypothetical protein